MNELSSTIIIEILNKHFVDLQAQYGLAEIGLFGSFARDEGSPESDIDILAVFSEPTFDNYMDLKFALEELFQRRVDLVTKPALKPKLKDRILAEVQYAA